MSKIGKVVGKINGIDIIQSLGLYKHISKHAEEYISVDSLNVTLDSITDILVDYDFVFYDEIRNSYEYYKKLIENVCIVVSFHNKDKYYYVATIFPVTQTRINNRKNKIKDKIEV